MKFLYLYDEVGWSYKPILGAGFIVVLPAPLQTKPQTINLFNTT